MTDSELRTASRNIFRNLREEGLAENASFDLIKNLSLPEQFFILRASLWYRVRITKESIDSILGYDRDVISAHANQFANLARSYM